MNKPLEAKEKSSRAPVKEQEPAGTVPGAQWLDRTANLWLHFDRFGWDIFGTLILVAAFLVLLGLLGWSHGIFTDALALFLRNWIGWGSYLVAVLLALLGCLALRGKKGSTPKIRLGQILALEGWVFTLLTLFEIWGGHQLEQTADQPDGGLIGWGLAEWLYSILPAPSVNVILLILLVIFTIFGFAILETIGALLDRLLLSEKTPPAGTLTPPPVRAAPSASASAKKAAPTTPVKRLPQPLLALMEPPKTVPSLRRDERLPPLNLLMQEHAAPVNEENIHVTADLIEKTLAEFGVPARVVGFRVGPTITQFAVEPGFIEKTGLDGEPVKQKVRVSTISALQRDLALALSAQRLRIEAPVPGESFVGVEVPNPQGSLVRLRSLLESEAFQNLNAPLGVALGKDVSGQALVADLTRLPHLLIAGTTGSGKSVCIQALTVCLAMNNSPDELRMAMIDPKMVELVRFNGLPHLMGKVETKLERMLGILRWALVEMDHRYRLLEDAHARDLESYNHKMARKKQPTLPRIVLLIDELADLMMSAPDQTEHSVVRLAQMARATGIHLIVATQRPSTDVITGVIKANFPARIAFTVASSIDSRVILDTNGAETLLGRGDMLFLNPEVGKPTRAQGAIVTDQEVDRAIGFWQKMSPRGEEAAPWEEILREGEDGGDHLVEEAVKIVRQTQHASASMLQRRLRVGYPRAARLIDELEELGVVGPSQGGGREREVLVPPRRWGG